MTSLGLVGALICLIIYSLYQRKEEMKLLQREGLSRNISKYFNNDNIILFIGWLLISLLGMVIMLWLFEVNRNYISIYFYIGYWIVTTLLLSVVIIFMKSMMVKRIVKKVWRYD